MRVIKGMYKLYSYAILLDGEKLEVDVEQGVTQGCSLSQILCSVIERSGARGWGWGELEGCCSRMTLCELVSLGNSYRDL